MLIPYLFPMFFYKFFLNSTNMNKTKKWIWSMFENVDLMIKCVFMASSYKFALNANTWKPYLFPPCSFFLHFFFDNKIVYTFNFVGEHFKGSNLFEATILFSYVANGLFVFLSLLSSNWKMFFWHFSSKRGGPNLFKIIFH